MCSIDTPPHVNQCPWSLLGAIYHTQHPGESLPMDGAAAWASLNLEIVPQSLTREWRTVGMAIQVVCEGCGAYALKKYAPPCLEVKVAALAGSISPNTTWPSPSQPQLWGHNECWDVTLC